MKTTMLEALLLVLLAGGIGTGFHLLRTDRKMKIAFVGDYPSPFRIPTAEGTRPGPAVPPPGPENPGGPPGPEVPGAPVVNPSAAPETPETPELQDDGVIREILIEEAKEEFDNGTLFLDARRTRHYEAGHIAGARSLSVWEADFEEQIVELLDDPDVALEMPIVVYCMTRKCEDSHMLAEKLKGTGFQHLMVFKGGFPEWQKANHPVETGPDPRREGSE